VVDADLNRRVAMKNIAPKDVPLHTSYHIQSIRVSENRVLLDQVAGAGCTDQTDSEIVSLSYETISTYPVPTEPVAARAAGQSYASARQTHVPASH
jgi:hypothetical protein